MKKIYAFVAVVLLAASILAQAPQSFKYQAVLRDGSGNVKASTAVSINISILHGSASGTAVYSETHSATTNAYGLVNLDLGNGTPTTGTFATIDWSTGTYYVKVAVDGIDMGTSQLLSVPYALNAKTAENGITAQQANEIAANTLKVGITTQQASDITANNAKVGYTDALVSANPDVIANTAKVGITTEQANAIAANTLKVGITAQQASEITANNAKVGITTAQADAITNNTSAISTLQTEQTTQNTAIALNTAKVGITAQQASDITANNAKVGVTNGTAVGQMQYWNGTAWITVERGSTGQVLTFINGKPSWGVMPTAGTGEVQNPKTGAIWKDRNLGATQVATSSTDASSYGDLYQWGRGTDGHEKRNSIITNDLSITDTPGHDNFITSDNGFYDWRSGQNANLWQGVSGTNNPCPAGYRLPTEAEWNAERLSWAPNINAAGAFASPLKLPVAGYRGGRSGLLFNVGSYGRYWSSTVSGDSSRYLYFDSSNAHTNSLLRADGCSVRCIKD